VPTALIELSVSSLSPGLNKGFGIRKSAISILLPVTDSCKAAHLGSVITIINIPTNPTGTGNAGADFLRPIQNCPVHTITLAMLNFGYGRKNI
jgi:hypothetical protein